MRYIVIGLGTFGMQIIRTLTEYGAEVIAIDKNTRKVEAVKDVADIAMALDSTDESAMKNARIDDVDGAFVALGDSQEEAILTTAILKAMGIHPIIARAADSLYGRVLKRIGADRVIIIEEQMGEEIAKRVLAPEIKEKIFLTTGHSLVEIEVRKEFIGKTLKDLDIRNKYGVNVIAIQRKTTRIGEDGIVLQEVEMNDLPKSGDVIRKEDILVVVGSEEDIEKLALMKE